MCVHGKTPRGLGVSGLNHDGGGFLCPAPLPLLIFALSLLLPLFVSVILFH